MDFVHFCFGRFGVGNRSARLLSSKTTTCSYWAADFASFRRVVPTKPLVSSLLYRPVDASGIPSERSEHDFWTADFSQPDGYGIGAEAWLQNRKPYNEHHHNTPRTAADRQRLRMPHRALLDHAARAKSYVSNIFLASYVNSTNPAWAAEASAFVAWRDAVWTHAYGELDKVMNGQRSQPTIAEFITELPEIIWPE